jgi:hypothetical protein
MASSSLGRKLTFAAFAVAVALGAAADAQAPLKVLYLGHSMTRHGVAPKIGWTNDWGMAASAREKDYAHLVARGIEAKTGRKTEVRLRNIASCSQPLRRRRPEKRHQTRGESHGASLPAGSRASSSVR